MASDPLDAPRMKLLKPWISKGCDRVSFRVGDARVHAERSLTQAVITAADGFPRIRALGAQRSFRCAKNRIEELKTWLAGQSDSGSDGFILDARARFYRDALGYWIKELPGELLVPNPGPSPRGEAAIRGCSWNGLTPLQELSPVFMDALNTLQTAVNAASIASVSSRDAILDHWEFATTKKISAKVASMLSNSQVFIYNAVAIKLIREEFRSKPS